MSSVSHDNLYLFKINLPTWFYIYSNFVGNDFTKNYFGSFGIQALPSKTAIIIFSKYYIY